MVGTHRGTTYMAMGEDKLAMTDLDAAVSLNKRSDLLSLANRYA
jgi:hypothetical protein